MATIRPVTLKPMRSIRGKLVFPAFALLLSAQMLSGGQVSGDSGQLRSVHDALFSTFLPTRELNQQPQILALLVGVRDGIWSGASQSQSFLQLLVMLAELTHT
jgi:hypothetical protein